MSSTRSPGKPSAFTLVELLVAVSITTILVVVMASVMDQTNRIWRFTTSKVDQFRESRDAFESMTRRISQATLNTYWDYNNPNHPSAYVRQSQLRFISGMMNGTASVSGSSDAFHPGHAIFFQAPMGFVQIGARETAASASGLDELNNLLNTWGYYLEWNTDGQNNTTGLNTLDMKPHFITSKDRFRFRLMEMMQPAQHLGIYAYTSGTDGSGNPRNLTYLTKPNLAGTKYPAGFAAGAFTGREWFTDWLYKDAATAGLQPHALAENIVALVFWPKLSAEESGTTYAPNALAPSYSYDSCCGLPAGVTDYNLNPHNQLPPVVQVTMVAIDEASAKRMQDFAAGGQGNGVPNLGLASLFTNSANYNADLFQLQANIAQQQVVDPVTSNQYNPDPTTSGVPKGMVYTIYSTNIAIKAAKWSRAQTQ